MENGKNGNISFIFGCTKCNREWDVTIRDCNPRLEFLQNFLNTTCINCGSDNWYLELKGIKSIADHSTQRIEDFVRHF